MKCHILYFGYFELVFCLKKKKVGAWGLILFGIFTLEHKISY